MSQLSVRESAFSHLGPLTLSWISVSLAAIAAVWLTAGTTRGSMIALVAATALAGTAHAGRGHAGQRAAAFVEWGQAGCGLLGEFAVYAGMAVAVSVHAGARPGLAGQSLSGTFVSGLGGTGSAGVWRLATMAVILAAVTAMTDICVHGPAAPGSRARLFGPPADIRLPICCAAFLLFGARAAFLAVFLLGAVALCTTVIGGLRDGADRGELRGYRGDGRLSVWIGKWVAGKVTPFPPLFVGLLVTGVLVSLGLGNLSGILLLTPVEAMLLAAFASWHPHDGAGDWLVPPLLQAAEYVFLAEVGYAGHVWPALTAAVVAAVGLRHLDLAYRVRGGLADGVDRRSFGWEGRMIIVGVAAVLGFAPVVYGLLALYLWPRLGTDWMVGWGKASR
jgi:hypothetical protein